MATISCEKAYTLHVAAVPLAIVSAPNPPSDGQEGVTYGGTALTVTEGVASNWLVTVGALPPGLALGNATGLITGLPTLLGSYNFTVSCTATIAGVDTTVTKPLNILISAEEVFRLAWYAPTVLVQTGWGSCAYAVGNYSTNLISNAATILDNDEAEITQFADRHYTGLTHNFNLRFKSIYWDGATPADILEGYAKVWKNGVLILDYAVVRADPSPVNQNVGFTLTLGAGDLIELEQHMHVKRPASADLSGINFEFEFTYV